MGAFGRARTRNFLRSALLECPEAITPAQSGGGGWVARHLMTMLRSRDVKVLEAVLNALAVLAEDNHDPMLLMFRKPHLGVDIQFEVANFSGRANSNDYLGPDILVIVHRHPYRILGDHWWRLRSRVREKKGRNQYIQATKGCSY